MSSLPAMKPGLLAIGFFLLMLSGCKIKSFAANYSASSNGNWENSSTWSVSRAPASNDTITIPSGKNVVVTTVTAEYANMLIQVSGTLHFNGGKKIRMCDGKIVVAAGGRLEADNAGSKVDICGNMVWDGAEDGTGPLTLSNPLPVELTDAKTTVANDAVTLSWMTAAEIQCDYFTIERSKDGESFAGIAVIKGAGTSTSPHYYSFTDFNPFAGSSFYRLSQANYDGHKEILKIFSVKRNEKEIALYPNPLQLAGSNPIELDIEEANNVTLTATDQNGREIFSTVFNTSDEKKQMLARLKESLSSPGLYFLKITVHDIVYYKRLAVVN